MKLRCPGCKSLLRFGNAHHNPKLSAITRSYYCVSCSAAVETTETITKFKGPAEDPRTGPRVGPKRRDYKIKG